MATHALTLEKVSPAVTFTSGRYSTINFLHCFTRTLLTLFQIKATLPSVSRSALACVYEI